MAGLRQETQAVLFYEFSQEELAPQEALKV